MRGSIGKWDPSAREGVFAGYEMRPGGCWSGIYRVWDLRDFVGASLQRDAAYKNIGFRSPHRSSRVELYNNALVFPLKQRYDRENATIDGVDPERSPDVVAELAAGDSDAQVVTEDAPVEQSSGPEALGIYWV